MDDADADATNELELPLDALEGQLAYYSNGEWQALDKGREGTTLNLCSGIPTWGTCPESSAYEVGEEAFGGIIYSVDDARGIALVVANEDVAFDVLWGCTNTVIGTSIDAGTGQNNTNLILQANCPEIAYAAKSCDETTLNGYDDWFLPSKNDLIQIRANLDVANGEGNFEVGGGLVYWSSSQSASFPERAWVIAYNSTGSEPVEMNKAGSGLTGLARPVRIAYFYDAQNTVESLAPELELIDSETNYSRIPGEELGKITFTSRDQSMGGGAGGKVAEMKVVADNNTVAPDGRIVFNTYVNNGLTTGGSMVMNSQGNVGIGVPEILGISSYKLQVGVSGDGTVAVANAWNTFSVAAGKRILLPSTIL